MHTWFRFLKFLAPYRGRLFLTFLATLTRPLLNAAKIYLLKLVVDNLVQHPTGNVVFFICGGYLVIALAKGLANYIDQYFGAYVGGQVVIDLRHQLFQRLLRLSLRYHHNHRVGESISRLISDVGAVEDVLVAGITDGVTQFLTVIIFTIMLFYLDPQLAAISLLILPFLLFTLRIYVQRSRIASREVRVRLAEITSAAEEALSAIALVKSFVRFSHEEEKLRLRGKEHWKARLSTARQRAIFVPLSDIVATLGTILVIYFGAQALAAGTLTVGGLVIFLAYLGQLYNPLLSLSRLGNNVQSGLAAAERVAALLDLPPENDEPQAATRPWQIVPNAAIAPAIAFNHVSFAYTPDDLVLRDFSLTVPHGAIVALVGASGGGKSTAVALLQRLYEPDAGQIYVFGHDVREFETSELRQLMAVVPQESALFMGSIYDNVAYGRLDASEEVIMQAAQQTGLLAMNLADGLNTIIGPRGTRLSGGQRQRVAMARALVRQAPLLIFDEATSALDTLSEERIRLALDSLRGQHTILIVAHRLSSVRSADIIAVVEHGHVVEAGRHEDLMKRSTRYAAFVQGQTTTQQKRASA